MRRSSRLNGSNEEEGSWRKGEERVDKRVSLCVRVQQRDESGG